MTSASWLRPLAAVVVLTLLLVTAAFGALLLAAVLGWKVIDPALGFVMWHPAGWLVLYGVGLIAALVTVSQSWRRRQ